MAKELTVPLELVPGTLAVVADLVAVTVAKVAATVVVILELNNGDLEAAEEHLLVVPQTELTELTQQITVAP